MRLAAHLCGTRCQDLLDGNYTFMNEIISLGFRRVQINFTNANNVSVDLDDADKIISNIRICMLEFPMLEFILQNNQETAIICNSFLSDPLSNMSFLVDSSCGSGLKMKEFPAPVGDFLFGYAGGIGPDTVKEILEKIREVAAGKSVWVDMESSLRTTSVRESGDRLDTFSIDNCMSCILICIDSFGLLRTSFDL